MFSHDEQARYQRHFSLPLVGTQGQQKLKQASVLCIGAGGLGSSALLYLAAAGIGRIGIVDDDRVELSNLQRQILYTTSDRQQSKAHSASIKLQALNPNVAIDLFPTRLTTANAFSLLKDYDLIIDGTDNFPTRYLVNDVCYFLNKPYVFASILGFEGQAAIFDPVKSPCYRCLFPRAPEASLVPNCAEAGVLGVLPGIMGVLQATEAIKFILQIGEPLLNKHLVYNLLTQRMDVYPIAPKKDCPLCQGQATFEQLERFEDNICILQNETIISVEDVLILEASGSLPALLDVRETYERELYHIGGMHIPLGQLSDNLSFLNKNQPLIVYCQAGKRSEKAAALLKDAGFTNVKSLQGGINAWQQAREAVDA